MLKYSIIIPHKNIPTLLRRCLDSIPNRPDIEIIVVDDNSNKESIKELKKTNRKELQIIYTTENKGAGFARNVGVANAHGEWILFADADDYFLPNIFEKLDTYKEQNKPIILFHSICRKSDIPNEPGMRQWICDIISKNLIDFQNGKIDAPKVLIGTGVPWAKMVRLSFLRKNNILFEEVAYSNDIGWITQLATKAKNNDITVSSETIYCLTDRVQSLYFTRNKEAFYCRFSVRCRQHQLLIKNGITSPFNLRPYLKEAQKFGFFFSLAFFKYILKTDYQIPIVYRFEQTLHLKKPYFFLLTQLIKSILNLVHNSKKSTQSHNTANESKIELYTS